MSKNKILETKNLSKSFGGLKAVDNVSLDVRENQIIGLIGPNGSGKSTFFNLVTRILNHDDDDLGQIIYENESIVDKKTFELAQTGLIRTFQNTKLFDKMTVLENMLLAAPQNSGESIFNVFKDMIKNLFGMKNWKDEELDYAKKALEILDLLEIKHLIFEKASVLSGGQRKLLSLGLVLMAAPKIILLDEPVAGVNPTLSNKIFAKINSIREQGSTFFIIEHNMDVIMDSCDFIYVMSKGQVIAHDVPSKVQNNPDVLTAYLGGEPE